MTSSRFISTILLLLVASSCLFAQVATTSLRGTVTDGTGAIVPEVTISLERKDTGFHSTRQSDKTGAYQFQQMAPGTYSLTVASAGFAEQQTTVQLLVDQPATLNIVLQVKSSETTVSVQADAETLNTTDAAIGNAVDNATVQALPMEGRNVADLLSLQPGVLYLGHNVNQDQDSRSGSVAGARSDQGNVTLDGLDNNDQVHGYAFTGVLRSTIDSVDEFKVSTTNAGVDSGRASGAQVNVVTKSGTNKFHGGLYEYNRNTLTAVNNWFNKEAQIAAGKPNIAGKLIRNTYGGSVGGPIRKDKIFFFANYEAQRTAENQQVTQVVPTAAFRAGSISYPYTNASGGLSPFTLSPANFAALDPHCYTLGTCPWGPGDNPNVLKVFNSYPLPNGSLAGDGYNTDSFTWSAPHPLSLGTYIAKIDYAISDRNRMFVRGVMQNDSRLDAPQFPGQPANNTLRDNTKGVAVGEIWSITPNLVNNARYGFTRQGYSNRGSGAGPFVQLASVSNPVGENRSMLVKVPSHNFIDDVDWTRGKHNFQFGVNYRLVHAITDTDAYSYNSGSSSGGEYYDSLANTGQDLDPSAYPGLGFPNVATSFNNSYSYAAMNLAGVVAQTNLNYVYKVNGLKMGTLLPQGTFVNRNFKSNQFEYYLQDTFHVLPKLSLTFGLRHSLAQTPYEVNGQQVSEDISIHKWFETRAANAARGLSVQPTYNYVLSGKANGGRPMWQMAKFDIAPRVGVAYALDTKTSIRAGAGLNYDNFGMAIANIVSTAGSAGLLGSNSTLAGWVSTQAAPRFTGLQNVPLPSVLKQPTSSVSFPFQAPLGAEAGEFTVDDGVKTPHSLQLDFSVQRQLPGGFTLETAYVGRMGRRLLQNRDIAMPLDLVDPKSGLDYFHAVDLLEKQHYANVATTDIQPIAYWENLFPDAANAGANGTGTPGHTATQNIYDHFATDPLNASYGIYSLDILCNPGCGGQQNRYYPNQYSNLSTESSIGTSSYHSGQVILRHPMRSGLQADFSYTFGKSLDIGSDAERVGGTGNGTSNNYYTTFSQILNAFNPKLNKAVSDYDIRHLVTADWVYELPFGHGRHFASGANGLENSIIGGWQLTGLGRWTSGLPFGSQVAAGWVTSWYFQSFIVKTGSVKMHRHIVPGRGPQAFSDPDGLQSHILDANSPIRYPIPGEAGSRNAFRGDGFFGIDSGLNKTWSIHERASLKFAWEVFNVTNSVRFDTNPNYSLQATFRAGNFGYYSSTLTVPRVQQFSLRMSF